MHCLLKSLSGGFAPPAALANFRSVFHSGLSLFKQLLFLHFELEFALQRTEVGTSGRYATDGLELLE
jgi:hypothetical protein